jgi:type I restriction enzyme S subunit
VYREYGVIEKSSRDDNSNRTPENLDAYQLVQPGDLVINKMKAWQGSLGVSRHTGITSPDYFVYRPIHNENAMYLHYLLRSKLMANVFLANSNGIRPNQWRLEPERFEDLPLIIPPIYEQDKIVAFLERETLQAQDLMERVASASDCLAELRTALISAAVTGKIDVREEVR